MTASPQPGAQGATGQAGPQAMQLDILIRGGTVVDGTGAPRPSRRRRRRRRPGGRRRAEPRRARATARSTPRGGSSPPGFVDIHTHLDAQLAWDPIGSSSCWPRDHQRRDGQLRCHLRAVQARATGEYLAELMESVEDIPRDAILGGLPWDWVTYGEYLAIGRPACPKGPNVGGMVGHCALRHVRDGRAFACRTRRRPTADDIGRSMATWSTRRCGRGARLLSTSRTLPAQGARRPAGARHLRGSARSCYAFADVLGRHGAGVFEIASRLGEGDGDDLRPTTRAELAWMGEVARRSRSSGELRSRPLGHGPSCSGG